MINATVSEILAKVDLSDVPKDVLMSGICKFFGISMKELRKKSKKVKYTVPRFYSFLILKEQKRMGFQDIVELHGMEEHSNAIHGIRRICNLIETDRAERNIFKALLMHLVQVKEKQAHKWEKPISK